MNYTFYELAMLFFTYFFLAWLCIRAVLFPLWVYRGDLDRIPAGVERRCAVPLSGKYGSGYCCGVVCRENTGKDEAEKVVGLF